MQKRAKMRQKWSKKAGIGTFSTPFLGVSAYVCHFLPLLKVGQ
jgi:hypothetical protein